MNSQYFNKDCLEILPTIPDKSVDLIFCDLPYHSTNCKWDSAVDLDKLWVEFKRIRKDTTPIVMTCTTKFGYELISSNKKEFKFDMVWQKSRKCGFLQARKRPLCNHEMVYFFYKKQPKYNYLKYHKYTKKEPASVITGGNLYTKKDLVRKNDTYEPPLPASVLVNDDGVYGKEMRPADRCRTQMYDPALPASVIVNNRKEDSTYGNSINDLHKVHSSCYEPQLPASIQPFKSTKPSKHQTGKPVDLMEFILKYWSDEGDTVFDPTFGGGSMPIACKIMNRKFIGCEMDEKFYNDTLELLNKY